MTQHFRQCDESSFPRTNREALRHDAASSEKMADVRREFLICDHCDLTVGRIDENKIFLEILKLGLVLL